MTETSFRNQIEQISQFYRQQEARESAEKQQRDTLKSQTTEIMRDVLDQFIADMLQSDERLFLDERSETSMGMCIAYQSQTNFARPSFQVSVTCKPGMVDVNVSDGHWKQVVGVLGLWADWTDQHQVFSGVPDTYAIRKSLETAFLTWYERAINSTVYKFDNRE